MDKSITSVHNERVKAAAKLRDRRQREKQRRFLIDGARELSRAIAAGVRLVELFVCEALCRSSESLEVLDRLHEIQADVWHVSESVFAKIAFGERAEGVLAVAET